MCDSYEFEERRNNGVVDERVDESDRRVPIQM
jgi:hypothetical protein